MGKLLKYEFRKTRNLKLIIIVITCLFEALFLVGLLHGNPVKYDMNRSLIFGSMGLVFTTALGLMIIAIYSTMILYKDLNTKQSYMLFLTPHSSWEILGAKVIENTVSFFVMIAFFALLAIIDLKAAGTISPDITLRAFLSAFDLDSFRVLDIVRYCVISLLELLSFTLAAFSAVIIQATLFNGKKYGGWLAFLLFIALACLNAWMTSRVDASYAATTLLSLVWVLGLYGLDGWLMQDKLSV